MIPRAGTREFIMASCCIRLGSTLRGTRKVTLLPVLLLPSPSPSHLSSLSSLLLPLSPPLSSLLYLPSLLLLPGEMVAMTGYVPPSLVGHSREKPSKPLSKLYFNILQNLTDLLHFFDEISAEKYGEADGEGRERKREGRGREEGKEKKTNSLS
jgi:hypothetical protein